MADVVGTKAHLTFSFFLIVGQKCWAVLVNYFFNCCLAQENGNNKI